MKQTVIFLIIAVGVVGVINIVVTTFWLQVAIVALVVIVILLTTFFAGVYVARDMMRQGADIVLKGQEINDKWDAVKAQSYAQFGKELIKVKTDSMNAGQQYPQLPPVSFTDGAFIIEGLDDKEN